MKARIRARFVVESGANRTSRDCGSGPVPGIRKRRGGPAHFRHPATTPEARLNAMLLPGEGEVSARRARCGANLPDSWDERVRSVEKSWKSQHQGRKAWDRGSAFRPVSRLTGVATVPQR